LDLTLSTLFSAWNSAILILTDSFALKKCEEKLQPYAVADILLEISMINVITY
jgi:hypothetical protein